MKDVLFTSAAEMLRRIRARDISVVEVVTTHLAHIDAVNPLLNAVVTRCDEMALQRARKADQALARGETPGLLHGLPITIKDAFDTAGVRSTGGTLGRADYIAPENATAVGRMLAAGAILIGKTNTPELTLFYDTDNLLFGETYNPYDVTLSPGGSSGGSVAIVAAGGSALDLGSDTGGSIRLPAHFCGVAGIKPTAGRVSRSGFILPAGVPVDPLTQVGPIARFVEDLALVLPIISGADWKDSSVVPMSCGALDEVCIRNLHIAFYTDNGDAAVSPEVAAVVRDCARVVAEQGARVTEARPPALDQSRSLFVRFFETDGGAWIRRTLQRLGTRETYPFLQWTERGDDAPEATASAFTALLEEWQRFRSDMLGFLKQYDVILAPVHTSTALPHGELTSAARSPAFGYAQTYNLTGWPSAVVRAGTCGQGLPIGLQVVARPWQEHVALAVASHIEEALGGWQAPPAFPVRPGMQS
ncbi:MAG: amidase [Gammaproteobacteria bacterium]|jgi:amidase